MSDPTLPGKIHTDCRNPCRTAAGDECQKSCVNASGIDLDDQVVRLSVKFQQRYEKRHGGLSKRVPTVDGEKVSGKRGTWPALPESSIHSLLFKRAVDIAGFAQHH
jgi:hypothetical protein